MRGLSPSERRRLEALANPAPPRQIGEDDVELLDTLVASGRAYVREEVDPDDPQWVKTFWGISALGKLALRIAVILDSSSSGRDT